MNLKPIGEKVIIERSEAEEKTKGGIVIPDTAKEKPKKGTVVAIGDGRLLKSGKRLPLTVKAGDRVIFTSYAGTEVTVDDKKYLIMGEEEILAVLR
jgi:chaperonin GroES